jgi:DMSO reductase anchor subunit
MKEKPVVPKAQFRSYYGKPVLNAPVWKPLDIAGYFFLGGLAGGSSVLGAGAALTDRPRLARTTKVGALGALGLASVALVHDLGRPERFANMLRVAKPTSPMSVGSWLLAAYGPLAGGAAITAVTGRLPRLGTAASLGAATVGPLIATYTAVLIADTAVPAWHEAYRELPFVFAGSAAAAAGGFGLLAAPVAESGPARTFAISGMAVETLAVRLLHRRLGMLAEPYRNRLMRMAQLAGVAGVALAFAGRGDRMLSAVAGSALLTASATTRFGVFQAGVDSASDAKYTVLPQRERQTGPDRH